MSLALGLPGWAIGQALPMAVTSETARIEALATLTDAPLRYAVGLPASLNEISGDSGGVSVFSSGAQSLGLRIRLHDWPADVPLEWRSEGMDTPHRIQPRDGQTQWLPDVPGDIGTLTWTPTHRSADARLTLELVYHGYRAINGPQARNAGSADTCNIDVACSEGADWGDQIRATVKVTVDEGSTRTLCSGALLNNTANDDRPLLITARHCGISNSNADSVIATFNFQRSVCGGANDGVSVDTISGSTWLAESVSGDTTLLELSDDIPLDFDAHLSGWSAETGAPTGGAGIHHPNGDQKKISLFNITATAANNQLIQNFRVDAWRIRWDSGTTQGGSSGSGLWNQSSRLVGVLSGGSHSCNNSSGDDFYGRLSASWDDSSSIREALDPVTTGVERFTNGRDTNPIRPSPSPPPVTGSSGGGGASVTPLVLLLAALVRRRILRVITGGAFQSKG